MFIRIIKSQIQKGYSYVQSIVQTRSKFSTFIVKRKFRLQMAQPAVANPHVAKWSTLSRHYFLTIVVAALLLSSCQKEKLSDTVVNSTNTSSSAEAKLAFPWFRKDPVSNYGALIGAPDQTDNDDFQLNVADQLGITCLRERVLVPCKFLNTSLVPELNTSYKVLLNFDSPKNEDGSLLPFVSDLAQYKIDLIDILNTLVSMPDVAVIENEESNHYYYSGTPGEYIDQLNAAITIMHARGIKVANGGITSTGLCYLVYQDLLAQGKEDSAEEFKQAVNVTPNSSVTQERGDFIDKLLNAYTNMDLDYVNFHWKATSPDTQAFNTVINYLQKRTGKKVISNELGQFDEDPNTLEAHVQACTNQQFPYIIWYSPDENDGKKGTPLQHSDASLTPTGVGYQDYLAD